MNLCAGLVFVRTAHHARRTRFRHLFLMSRYFLTGLLALILILPVSHAYACSPPPGPPPTLAERWAAADVVFSGRVVRTGGRVVSHRGLPSFDLLVEHDLLGSRYGRFFRAEYLVAAMPYYALVEVDRYFRGGGIGEVAVMGFGYGSDCLNSAEAGDHFLFFTTGESPLYALRYLYPHSGVMRYDRRTQNELVQMGVGDGQPADVAASNAWLPVGGTGVGALLLALRGLRMLLRG